MKAAKSDNVRRVGLFILFMILAVLALFPFYCLLLGSFKPTTELLRHGLNVKLQPELWSLENYKHLFTTEGSRYWYWYRNSVVLTTMQTVASLFFSAFVGYGLAIYQFKGRNLLFGLVLFTMMIPLEILILPLYKTMIFFRLINTYSGVILPFVVTPFAVFFFRQYALGLPKDLLDAARIDGCTEFGAYFRVMMPLMLPAFGAMAILQALFSWNSLLWPLIVLRTTEMFTLPIGLASLLSPYGNNYMMLMSGAVLSVLPILLLFLLFQRAFMAGLTIGAVKG
ncbi:MAG: carbohydrate ABC transporter permease [Candidatus Vecturithrix sp.]|jgi:arabinosaccharide transport system permease protein|nr:carbohydrate ABC transporter permease [Candidatus Vecturithrix sp.]